MKLTATQTQELTDILAKIWNNQEDMVKHCLKNRKYVQLADGRYVDVSETKTRIESEMWYDDTTAGPDTKSFDVFKAYNLRNAPQRYEATRVRSWGEERSLVLLPQYRGDTEGKLLGIAYQTEHERAQHSSTEEVTPEQLETFNSAIDEVRADFEKRLATYWKRYSNKVSRRGYWADR